VKLTKERKYPWMGGAIVPSSERRRRPQRCSAVRHLHVINHLLLNA